MERQTFFMACLTVESHFHLFMKTTVMDSNKLLQLKVKGKVSIRSYLTSETAAWLCYHWSDNSQSIHFNPFTPPSTPSTLPLLLKAVTASDKSCTSERWNANVWIRSHLTSETSWVCYHKSDNTQSVFFNPFTPPSTLHRFQIILSYM